MAPTAITYQTHRILSQLSLDRSVAMKVRASARIPEGTTETSSPRMPTSKHKPGEDCIFLYAIHNRWRDEAISRPQSSTSHIGQRARWTRSQRLTTWRDGRRDGYAVGYVTATEFPNWTLTEVRVPLIFLSHDELARCQRLSQSLN
jgi:hypothetical protein